MLQLCALVKGPISGVLGVQLAAFFGEGDDSRFAEVCCGLVQPKEIGTNVLVWLSCFFFATPLLNLAQDEHSRQ